MRSLSAWHACCDHVKEGRTAFGGGGGGPKGEQEGGGFILRGVGLRAPGTLKPCQHWGVSVAQLSKALTTCSGKVSSEKAAQFGNFKILSFHHLPKL